MNKSYHQSALSPEDIESRERAKAKRRQIERLRIEEVLEDDEDEYGDDIRHFIKQASKQWK